MNVVSPASSAQIKTTLRLPGLLLQPFQWAADPVMRMALAEPRLLAHLTDLDALRLHVIALYLAFRGEDSDEGADATFLASARSRDILEKALGRQPGRLLGLLRRLPNRVMWRSAYIDLARLALNDVLVNAMMNEKNLDYFTIYELAEVPSALLNGPLLKAVGTDFRKLASVAGTAAWFVRHCNVDATARFTAVQNLSQLRRLVSDLLRTLPPEPRLPPRVVGRATMIESAEELRWAGRTGRNCLGDCVSEFALNTAAFYIWNDGDEPIYIRIGRSDGLGWFLYEMKIADNDRPSEDRRSLVEQAFRAAGIDSHIVIVNLIDLVTRTMATRRTHRRRRR